MFSAPELADVLLPAREGKLFDDAGIAVIACRQAVRFMKNCSLRWVALVVTAAAMVFTGDFTLAILNILTKKCAFARTGLLAEVVAVLFTRPASLALLAMGIFYLWVYVRRAVSDVQIDSPDVVRKTVSPVAL